MISKAWVNARIDEYAKARSLSDGYRRFDEIMERNERELRLARVETLSAAHRLLGQLADDTLSRETQAECRDVMAKLKRMVADA